MVLLLCAALSRPGWAQPPPELPAETEEFRQTGQFPEERADADGDGIADIDDNCPGTPGEQATPAGTLKTQVDECGCPRDPCICDSDVDGVPDCKDLCPNTPVGDLVGADGCTLPVAALRREELEVQFDFEKADIRPEFEPGLLKLRELLLSAPNLHITFEGHADWKGPQSFNQPLSERRAAACRDFVLRESAIAPERIKILGFGELRPIADNKTEEGRARNRRVTAVIYDLRSPPPQTP